MIVPNSWGAPRLREYNPCHDPKDGRFCTVGFHGTHIPGLSELSARGGAVWFSDKRELAQSYAKTKAEYDGGTATLYKAQFGVQNPLTLPFDMNDELTAEEIQQQSGVAFNTKSYATGSWSAWEIVTDSPFMKAAAAMGYDAIRVNERGFPTIGVFHPVKVRPHVIR